MQYKTGGLVDYTGPAWVDGTKSKPEAFLSASDTDNIAKLRDILSTVFDSNKVTGSSKNVSNENSGDITYEIHINVDHLDDGYDADKMMKDIEKHITSKAGFRKVTKVSRR